MANEFLQYFSLMQNQGMQQLNLAMGMQSLGLRRNQQALTERSLALREQELPIAAEAERTKRADSLVGIFSTLSPLMSTEQQKSSMSILTDTLSQIGVLPKGGTIDFANLEETRLRVHQKIQDRDLEGAQQEFIKYRQQAHPGERQFGLEVLGADAAIQRERQQDPMAQLMEGRKRGIVIGERQAAQMKAADPVGFQQELDTRGLVVVSDGMLQSIDARTFELDGLSLMDPALVNEFFETKVMAARGMNVSDEKRQKAIVMERYLANNALQANLKANGLPVSEETEQTGIDLAIQLDLQEKRKAPPNEAERLANEAKKVKMEMDRTTIAKNNKSLAILDKELIHMDIDAQVKREMIPKIKAATDLLNNQALNVEGRTKIAEQDAQRVQAQYAAMLPDLTQRQQELTEANTQLVNELRVAANDPDSTPAETTLMQQEIHANNRMLQFVEQEIAFAQAVGPKMFVELQNLQSMIEHREEVRKAKTQEMNDLQRQTQDLRLAQTEGKEFENEQKRRAAAVADASALIANEAARRGVTGDKGMVKLIDEMKQAGTIPTDTLATPKSVKDFLTDQAAGAAGDPFAVTRAVSTAINNAAKNSNVAIINPVTGQVDAIALFEKNPRETKDYIKQLQVQADSNPALKQGLQPIINELKDKERRVAIQKQRFQSVEKKLPHNLKAQVSPDGRTMEDIVDQINDGDIATAKFKSNGVVFTVQKGSSGKVEISATLDGQDLTFALEGTGDKRQWLYLDDQ